MRIAMRTFLSMLVLGVTLAAAALAYASARHGTVDSVSPPHLTVSGQQYTMDAGTELLDRGGHRIALSELIPGTPVELEVDDEGTLVAVRATLVR
jgi:hypothetical protein